MNDSPAAHAGRTSSLTPLLALVLLWNGSYTGARVLDAHYALELGTPPARCGQHMDCFH